MKKFTTRFLTVFLAIAILIASLPMSVFAAELNELLQDSKNVNSCEEASADITEESSEEVYALGEDTALRTAKTKQIRMSDGSYYAAMYANDVHFLNDEGEWEEIDNTLIAAIAEGEDDFSGVETKNARINVKFANNSNSSKLVAIKTDDYKISFGLVGANAAKGVTVNNPEPHGKDVSELDRIIQVKKAVSSVVYHDILENTDLEYVVSGSGVKENIIVKEKANSYVYEFDMKLNKLTAELASNGTIVLKDEKSDEVMFTLGLPFMYDANGASSNAVTYSLEKIKNKEYRITVTADSAWMNDESRAYPVTVDPPITTNNNTNIKDGMVKDSYPWTVYSNATQNYIGYTDDTYPMNDGLSYLYWKITELPQIPNNCVIIDAKISMVLLKTQIESTYQGIPIGVYQSSASWDENTLNWNNRPSNDGTMLDYKFITPLSGNTNKVYSWNITRAAKTWYENNSAGGVVFQLSADLYGRNQAYFASCRSTYNYPRFSVIYRSSVGLEDYYTYNTQSIGRAGTGYINHFTSLLTLVHPDLFSNSEALPFSISHVYNSANAGLEFITDEASSIHTAGFSKMKFGKGWKLSVQESLISTTVGNEEYLIYNDSDGTEHYFYPVKDENNIIIEFRDEDGLSLTVTRDSFSQYTMTDKGDNKRIFRYDILTQIVDANGNQLDLIYTSNQLTEITRKNAGCSSSETLARFTYNGSHYLTKITDAYGRETSFTYSDGLLTKITYPDDQISEYTYDANHVMTSAYDAESNYGIKYTVSSLTNYSKGRILGFNEYYRNQSNVYTGRKISIEGQSEKSVSYVDWGTDGAYSLDDIVTTYRFDLRGRTIGTYSTDLQKMKIYGVSTTGYTEDSGASANKISSFSTTGALPLNLVSNGSFEKNEVWTKSGMANYSNERARTGNQSIKLQTPASALAADAYVYQSLVMGNAEAYTLSVYVSTENITNILEDGGIYLMLEEENTGEVWFGDVLNAQLIVDEDNPWQRITLTFNPEDRYERTFNVYLYMAGIIGSVYVDDFQVEESSGASNYNLLGSIDEWDLTGNASFSEYGTPNGNIPAISMSSNPTEVACAYLTVPIQKSSDTTFLFSGWACGYSVPSDPLDSQDARKKFELEAKIYYSGNGIDTIVIPFDDLAVSTPQYLSGLIVPKRDGRTIERIDLKISYSYNANHMYFYNLALVEESAQTYSYDVNGNLIAAGQTSAAETSLKYDENDRLIEQKQNDQKFVYTYRGNTQLVNTVTSNGITSKYTYDTAGNVTGTVITAVNTDKQISSGTTYTEDKNFVSSVTDASGNTTSYAYYDNGLLEYSQNANGTRVYYKYDTANDQQTQAYIDGIVFAAYEYTNGTLSKITRKETENATLGTQEYSFAYDHFGNVTEVKVGSAILVTYTYGENNGNLLKTTYGNGTFIENVYDRLDRVVEIKYNGITRYQYFYNGNGHLSRVKDVPQNTVYLYDYDSLGRLISSYVFIGSQVDIMSRYAYDEQNRISVYRCGLSETVGETVNYAYAYAYDERKPSTDESTGLLEELAISGTGIGGDTINYSYDAFQRLTTKNTVRTNLTLAQEYSYKNLSGNRTTTQISGYTAKVNGTAVDFYTYTYDSLGNITVINRNNGQPIYYTYDAQGQLVSVLEGDFRYDFIYDTYGNILSVEYVDDYSDDVMSSDTYTYGNDQWIDRLTRFNGHDITYDGIGNPLSYYNGSSYTFTWNGRELAAATKDKDENNSTAVSYKYGADGLRTQKTVGDTVYNYYYSDGLLIRQTWGTNYMDFLYDESGSAYSFIYNGTQYYYVKNLQGDVMRIMDTSGTVVANYYYDAWGKVTNSGTIIGLYNPIRYRGYYYDTDTGFYYLQSRYYDPVVKRFISADDASLIGANGDFTSLNLYAYCGNNPITRVDSNGHFFTAICIGFAVGIVGQYIDDVIGNIRNGKTIVDIFTQTSSASDYLASGIGGAIAAIPGLNLIGTMVVGAIGNVVSEGLKGKINNWEDLGKSALKGGVANGIGYGVAKGIAALKVKQIANMPRSSRKVYLRDKFYCNSQVNVNKNLQTFANSPLTVNISIAEKQFAVFRSGIYSTITSTFVTLF